MTEKITETAVYNQCPLQRIPKTMELNRPAMLAGIAFKGILPSEASP